MGGSHIKYIPLTKEQKWSRQWMQDLAASGTPNIPTQGVAGMSGPEQQAQTILQQYMGQAPRGYEAGMQQLERTLGGGYDPMTSPEWQGFREASAMDEAKAVSGLRRGAQAGGMFYSDPSQRAEGELKARYGADRSMLYGKLQEAERNRQAGAVPQIMQYGQMPAQQAAQGMELGAVPRQIDQARQDAQYNTLLQRIMFPYTQGQQMAGNLWGMTPDYTIEDGGPSGLSQGLSALGTVASIVAAPMTGGASLAAGAALRAGLQGGSSSTPSAKPASRPKTQWESSAW